MRARHELQPFRGTLENWGSASCSGVSVERQPSGTWPYLTDGRRDPCWRGSGRSRLTFLSPSSTVRDPASTVTQDLRSRKPDQMWKSGWVKNSTCIHVLSHARHTVLVFSRWSEGQDITFLPTSPMTSTRRSFRSSLGQRRRATTTTTTTTGEVFRPQNTLREQTHEAGAAVTSSSSRTLLHISSV